MSDITGRSAHSPAEVGPKVAVVHVASLLGVTQSSTCVARASVISGGSHKEL